MLHTRVRAVALTAPLVLLAVATAACGGGTAGASSSKTTTTVSGAASESAFRACLQQHGVTLPTRPTGSTGGGFGGGGFGGGGFGGGGGSGSSGNSQFATAFQACASLRPKGTGTGGSFGSGSSTQALALKTYINCLSIHGVTVPSSGTAETTALRQIFTDPTAKEKTAVSACASLRPKFSGRPGGSTTTTTAPAS
jgi:hypothetical protein